MAIVTVNITKCSLDFSHKAVENLLQNIIQIYARPLYIHGAYVYCFLVYLKMLSQLCRLYSVECGEEFDDELCKMWKEMVMVYLEVLYKNMHKKRLRKTMKSLSHAGQVSSQGSLKYKAAVTAPQKHFVTFV
jgi:hypothetical protein